MTATTTSWSDALGGVTTFNRTLDVQQAAPIYAAIARIETNLMLNWTGGVPPFRLEQLNVLGMPGWREVLNSAVPPVKLPNEAPSVFYRIRGR